MKRHHTTSGTAGMIAIALLLLTCIASGAKPPRSTSDADIRKSDYIFLEALRQKAQGNSDAYYELIGAAYELNPDDKYLKMQQGMRRLFLLSDADSVEAGEVDGSLALMRDYVQANPSDVYSGIAFAQFASHLDRPDDALQTWATLYSADESNSDIAINYVDALLNAADSVSELRAMAVLDSIEKTEGTVPPVSIRRMRVYQNRQDTAAVKGEVGKLLRTSPSDINYLIFAGRLYTELGENDSALVFFNRAVDVDPTSGSAYYNRAIYYNQIGDSVAYDREVNNVMQIPDLDIEPKLEILKDYVIKLYQDSTQHARISDIFQSLIDQNPHEPQVRKLYADYLVAIRDYGNAAEQKSYELDMNPSDMQSWLMLSSLYLQNSDYAKASAAALRGTRYYPEEPRLYELAAVAEIQADSLDSARSLLDKAIAVTDSTDFESLSNLYSQIGDIYYRQEQMDSMKRYYEQSLELYPLNLLALNNYAYYISCEDGGDLDRALEMIEKVMALETDNPTSLDTYAWVLFKRKDYNKAREIIDRVMELSEGDESADIFEHAGDIYFMDGQPETAVEFWQKALELDPDNALLKKKVKHKTFFYN